MGQNARVRVNERASTVHAPIQATMRIADEISNRFTGITNNQLGA